VIKPMLAASECADITKVKYPLIASPKLDGVRCLVVNGKLQSRNGKPIPNRWINEILTEHLDLPEGLDGELICGNFQQTMSAVTTRAGQPKFKFHVFDRIDWEVYSYRLAELKRWCKSVYLPADGMQHIKLVPTKWIKTAAQLSEYEARMLTQGYEGLILRSPHGVYKHGRSTHKEGGMLKLKQFEDSEATIVGLEEECTNTNPRGPDGKRTTHKAGMKFKGTLGKFVVVDKKLWGSKPFRVGSGRGLTKALRQKIWDNQKQYLTRRVIKYKYQPIGSTEEAPRIPIFLGFRIGGM